MRLKSVTVFRKRSTKYATSSGRTRNMLLRLSITKKFVFAFLVLALAPLCALGLSTLRNLREVGQQAIDSSTIQLESRAKESLELRSIELANRVSQVLLSCEEDLLTLKLLPRNPEVYQRYSLNHRKTIWTRGGTNEHPTEVHKQIPLYRELAFIGADGKERIVVSDDRMRDASELRDVSLPENTTYKCERYFTETTKLGPGAVYVSHVTGWFVPKSEQLGRATRIEDAVEGKQYEGVIRFATPCHGDGGELEGVVMVSLDHRHIMELTLHILPTEERFVVFPSYSSGNYAFMFDDEGWMISHPKFYDIRGVLPDGREFDTTSESYSREQLHEGRVPFNLDHVGFIDPNYPFISREVRAGKSGVTTTYNVGGTQRVMAYAPISFNRYPYDRYGVFGGITIGLETAKFREPALSAGAQIDSVVEQTKRNTLLILSVTALIAVTLAVGISRQFTGPILLLAGKAKEIAAGRNPDSLAVTTGDEVELLAENFSHMTRQIQLHRENLEQSVEELAGSKKEVEQYSRQLEMQLRVVKQVHYLSTYLSTVYDRELVLQTVLRTCVEGLGYDRALLYLYHPQTRRLLCDQTFGFSPEHEQSARSHAFDIDKQDCIPTKVFRSGETILIKDILTDPRATPLDARIADVGKSDCFVFTPLKCLDRVIGVLGADTKTSHREIGDTDVESLEILASDAARAIERSELHAKLIGERNFIKSIVTHARSGIITMDDSGKVTWFNPACEQIFRLRPEDALGKHYSEVFSELPSWVEVVDRFLGPSTRDEISWEHHAIRQDGREKVLEVYSSRIHRENQQQAIVVLFVRDITQRKRMEDHLRRSDRLVSLGVLAAGIAHEMRNPLTGISLMMDDLHDHLRDRPQERDLIQRSLEEIDRLENLINGLLDFAVPSRNVNLEVRPLDNVLESIQFLVRKLCDRQNVSLHIDAPVSLPLLNLDPEKLQQALLNLLLNAIHAMPDGGSLRMEVKSVSAEESLLTRPAIRIVVADTGIGIPDEDIPFIFDPFFSRNPSGCGLGLAIVHAVVEEHNGRISVFSKPGEGTTFWVDLPAVNRADVEAQPQAGS
jgi:PAS domain S-box-containing protein